MSPVHTPLVYFPGMFRSRRNLLIVVAFTLSLAAACTLGPRFTNAQADVGARRAELQRQLNDVEAQIAQTNATINGLKGQGASLQRDISILDGQIKKLRLQIQVTDISLSALAQNITLHSNAINVLSGKLDEQEAAVAEIIRRTRQYDDFSIVEIALSTQDLSTLLSDLDTYANLKSAINESSKELSSTRTEQEKEKDSLVDQRRQTEQLKALKVSEQNEIKQKESEKQKLLALNKGETARYQSIKAVQEKSAAQIRAELFALAGGGGAIPLPTAIAHAQVASRITGVRPAFILAILSQESDLGRNVGQCLITDLSTGDGKGKNTGTPFPGTMKVPRDTVPFEQITAALGRDWSTTPVSCPLPGGYGGAMGPTQFIPSTWIMYAPRIKSSLGVAAADPWNPLHAIVATGLYLSDVGGVSNEHTAAAKYYAGGNWATSGQAYANSVTNKAAQFQADIDTLGGR
jgi:membrane-bound lytic murein transglycosylase B